jgi:adenine-specific DNA-methyltransferase
MESRAVPTGNFDAAHRRVCELCDHFDERRDEILSPEYREATARAEFITPFFEALGWDVNNVAHRSIYDKDCVLEKAEAHGGVQRTADYAFRRAGTHFTAFFVEAKKPSIDIRGHEECYQAVLYGWNASTPLVVLTNFEQFLILDARSRPDKRDATRHILRENGEYGYADYRDAEEFTEIWGLFSRDAVANGAIERGAAALPRQGRIHHDEFFARGTRAVDNDFLAQMERWRETLAKSLKRTNNRLDGEQLTAITQRVLDRLIFLRFLQDRLIERDVTFEQLGESGSAWRDFERVTDRLDARYNGIIYKHDRDGIDDPGLLVDDGMFASVVEDLEPRNSDYKFATIPVTILGSIYERFLGNVIVATDKTARVEQKPENLKQHGVYYTPDYVVRYIVDETVGRSIAKKTPNDIAAMRFADIACGSGSFLVEIFATLIRYHLRWYLATGAAKWEKRGVLRQRETDGDYVLSLVEKRRILLNNIYGVDIDPQAVEVTQLSLYLRLLEDESFPSTQLLFDTEHRALLPDLRDNIICGNSIVETDIGELFGLTSEEQAKLRPLDLRYAFRNIQPNKDGAIFDAVVGNPPYVLVQSLQSPDVFDYLAQRYSSARYKIDTYHVFMERAVRLLHPGGRFAYITPNSFLLNKHARELRRFLLSELAMDALRLFDYQVFLGASVDTAILSARKAVARSDHQVIIYRSARPNFTTEEHSVSQKTWGTDSLNRLLVAASASHSSILQQILDNSFPLGKIATAYFGIQTFDRKRYVTNRARRGFKPIVDGAHIDRYELHSGTEFVDFRPDAIKSGGKREVYEQERIGVRQIGATPIATILPKGLYTLNTIYNIYFPAPTKFSLKFVLGVLESKVIRWFWLSQHYDQKRTFPKIKKDALLSVPIPSLRLDEAADRIHHDEVVRLVDKLIAAKAAERKSVGAAREHWIRQNESLERQIDELVPRLYKLRRHEIDTLLA